MPRSEAFPNVAPENLRGFVNLTKSQESYYAMPDNGVSTFDHVARWISELDEAAFFDIGYYRAMQMFDDAKDILQGWKSTASGPNTERRISACKPALEEIQACQDEMKAWKRESKAPLSHRDRDLSRRPARKQDWKRRCVERLPDVKRTWDVIDDLQRKSNRDFWLRDHRYERRG